MQKWSKIHNANKSESLTAEDRFTNKFQIEPSTNCWVWTGSVTGGNTGKEYPVFCPDPRRSGERKIVYAHRWSYEHFIGPIPYRHVIDHTCLNKKCVNPEHLDAVTQTVNNLRKVG